LNEFIVFAGVFALAAALGVSAVLKSMPAAYDTLRIIGAACLAYLGIKAFRNAGTTSTTSMR
jgi:threonine/homoserine/homoserine lactone efflux protein